MSVATATPREPVYRVGFAPNAWVWAPWEYGPFDGRWDDPEDVYRVIYTGSTAEACFLEVLAVFRPDPGLNTDYDDIEASPQDEEFPTVAPGVVDPGWCHSRRLGTGRLLGEYVDVAHSRTIATLRPTFLRRAMHYGLPDFDAAAIKMAKPRAFTKEISRYLYGIELPSGRHAAGVFHRSRHGEEHELWAVFERSGIDPVVDTQDEPISQDSPALLAALRTHHLVFG